ncbi:MAG: hypothetical protein FJ241_05685 [Nitrospira sp.]|nr:hypothetical protein [Nitrospira sp.]
MEFIALSSNSTLRFALLVMGFTATASQILIMRELLVTFHGNELFMGIILGNWLILEAVGSYSTRKRADYTKRHVNWFAILQITIGFSSLLSILFIRSFKFLFNIPTGEVLGIYYVAIISLIALAPVSMTDGALFPFGCRNFQTISEKKGASARVYLYESIGSFVAGMIFVFYLIYYLSSVELAFIILSLNLCSVIFYLTSAGKLKIIKNVAAGLMALIIISFSSSVPEWLHESSSKLLWYEYSLIDTRNSVYSNVAIIKNEDQYTFFANGAPYATTPVPAAQVEETAHFPMLFHERPEHILVVGGGAGGLLRELLKHPVKDIDYTEHDPLVIEGFRRFPTPLTEYELDHANVKIHLLEGRLFLRKASTMYDLILINLPIPSTLQINRYYTVEFFKLAKSRLKDRGIFAMRLPGSETFLSKELKELNRTFHASLRAIFPHVRIIAGEQNIFIASSDGAIKTVTDETLIERLHLRNISAGLINEWYLRYKMDSARFGEIEEDIASSDRKILNQDSYPRGVFEGMLFLNLVVSPYMVKILNVIDNIPYTYYILSIMVLLAVFLGLQQKIRQLFLTFAIASTGFTSMLISILLILYFQIYYGYVYHYIGILTSLFMLGSAIGAFFAMKRIKTSMTTVETGILFLTGFLYLFILSGPETNVSQLIIFGSMVTIGFLTGMEYPLAVSLADSSYRAVSSTAGRFYAFDLFGAFLGAILTAVVFIPTIGIKNTLLITMAIKSGSLLLVYMGRKTFSS